MQIEQWCEDVFGTMTSHVDDYEDPADYRLTTADSVDLQKLLMGKHFDPILAALDSNVERVAARVAHQEAIHNFRDYRRDTATRELGRWLDSEKDYDEDDYTSYENPKAPLKYSDWMDIENSSDSDLRKAFASLVGYTTNLHWKIDHLLRHTDVPKASTPAVLFEQLKKKFPFLAECDDHVANLTNDEPIQLGRTAAVCDLLLFCERSFFVAHMHYPTKTTLHSSYSLHKSLHILLVSVYLRIFLGFSQYERTTLFPTQNPRRSSLNIIFLFILLTFSSVLFSSVHNPRISKKQHILLAKQEKSCFVLSSFDFAVDQLLSVHSLVVSTTVLTHTHPIAQHTPTERYPVSCTGPSSTKPRMDQARPILAA